MRIIAGPIVALTVNLLLSPGCGNRKPDAPYAAPTLLEGLPQDRIQKMRARQELLGSWKPRSGATARSVVSLSKRWRPGEQVTVAFRGGSTELHRQIARIAATWSTAANIAFDFGFNPVARTYRTWSTTDTTASAQIRIGFDEPGYFSCVGTDSLDPACAAPNQSSMNFQGFDRGMPPELAPVVLHEFGHALGFEHEHQSPKGGCDAEFRWDDDPGYQPTPNSSCELDRDPAGRYPGIYTRLGGCPNSWSPALVDAQLRSLPDSSAFDTGTFDRQSIMKYDFPSWMYRSGRESRCFSSRNEDLSPLDREGAARAYPRTAGSIHETLESQSRALRSLEGLKGQARASLELLDERASAAERAAAGR